MTIHNHARLFPLGIVTGRPVPDKWIGFDRVLEINSAPGQLAFVDGSTSRATLEQYSSGG